MRKHNRLLHLCNHLNMYLIIIVKIQPNVSLLFHPISINNVLINNQEAVSKINNNYNELLGTM